MTVVVLTIDQRGSRREPDLVPALVGRLDARRLGPLVRRFERTAGDEIQGIAAAPGAVVGRVEELLRDGRWNVGLGIGQVEKPLPRSTRAGRGEAFVLARQAVTRAKWASSHLSVVGVDEYRADQLETVLWLWAGILGRRSARGWEVTDLLDMGLSHAEAGVRLGISQSAVSQRAATAGLVEGRRAARLAGQLLATMLDVEQDAPGGDPA